MARAVLAASRPHWSPEEAARRDYELLRLLATDPGAQKVYFRKLAVEASLAARLVPQPVPQVAAAASSLPAPSSRRKRGQRERRLRRSYACKLQGLARGCFVRAG